MELKLNKVFYPLHDHRYTLFLVANLLLVFSTAIPIQWSVEPMVVSSILAFHVFSGTMLWFGGKSRLAIFFFYFGLGIITLQFLETLNIFYLGEVLAALYVVFLFAVSTKVYRDIYHAREIDLKMVFAVFTGLIMLGIMATFMFVVIERMAPHSFNGMDPEMSLFDNLLYFSFISLLTIGYGDMAPATSSTKTLTILLGLIGNFYTIIVTGIVIGKYLSGSKRSQTQE